MPGIEESTNPRLSKASGELAAWVEFLLRPESNDGPRIYRPIPPMTPEMEAIGEVESPYRMELREGAPQFDDPREYETISVLEDFAADTTVFHKAAQAVSGISTAMIEVTYDKLTKGCLTWKDAEDAKDPGNGRVGDISYEEKNATRANWVAMRTGWTAIEAASAHAYEEDFLRYQVFTENAFFVVAEHLVRYRAVLHKAGEDILELVQAMVEMCPKKVPEGQGGLNLFSVLVTGLVAAAATVIGAGSGGVTTPVLLGVVVTEMIGEAVKTAEVKGTKNELVLDIHTYLRDTARQYLDQVDKIERDTAQAINDLRDSLRRQLDSLRQDRIQEVVPQSGETSGAVPRIGSYLP
ncbi:hypothetical protein [Actinophytocola sediminis]